LDKQPIEEEEEEEEEEIECEFIARQPQS